MVMTFGEDTETLVSSGLTLGLNPKTGTYEVIDPATGKFISLADLPAWQEAQMGSGGIGGVTGAVQQGVDIASAVAQLFGGGGMPSDISKFQLEAYPLMVQQARNSGFPVYCYWFQGQIIAVLPDGTYGTVLTKPTLADAYTWWNDRAKTVGFYVLECGGQGTALLSGCSFKLLGAGNSPDTLGLAGYGTVGGNPVLTTTGGLSMTWLLLIGGALLIFVLFSNRGK